MKTVGCYKNFNTAGEVLEHLGSGTNHFGFGLGGSQLRSNGTEYYLRVYDGTSESRYITKPEAISLIRQAMDIK